MEALWASLTAICVPGSIDGSGRYLVETLTDVSLANEDNISIPNDDVNSNVTMQVVPPGGQTSNRC